MSLLYSRLMHHAILPLMLAPTRSRMRSHVRSIRQRQRWPIEEIQRWQLDLFRQVVAVANEHSQLYRERLKRSGVTADSIETLDDIGHIPITTKSDIETNFPDRMVVAERRSSDWAYVGTRGTTRRVMVVQDFERRDAGRAASMITQVEDSPYRYGASVVSIPPDACSVHCGLENTRASSVTGQLFSIASFRKPFNRESVSDLRGLVMDQWVRRSHDLPPLALDSPGESLPECIEELRRHRPVQLVALPEYLRDLARYILRTGDRPQPIPIIRAMGANFPESWRDEVATAFRGTVREHYGSREMGPMAFDCIHRDGMHLLTDQHYIEVVRDGKPVDDGEIGQVLVTDLQNYSMPIIRYQIGDLARLDRRPCRCGRQTPRIKLEGRLEDAFVLSSGRVLTAEAVSNFFATVPGVADFQLEEKANELWLLRLVPHDGHELDGDSIIEKFRAFSGVGGRISVRIVKLIRPESSGKYRHTKSISYSRFDATSTSSTCLAAAPEA
tara:strand:+ start:76779 stop:78278 length:1500 start_codon:yes stop_codon:yes gene_type:complete